MKMVMAMQHGHKVTLQWRDDWDLDKWLPGAEPMEDGWEYPSHMPDKISMRIHILAKAFSEHPTAQSYFQVEATGAPIVMPLCHSDFVSFLVKELPSNLSEWSSILTHVANLTNDDRLHGYIRIWNKNHGRWNEYSEQQNKTGERIKKANKTKKQNPKKPGDKHIITAYHRALSEDGKPEGIEAKKAFYKKVIRYADAERLKDDEIELPNNAWPTKWGAKWTTAENRVSRLRVAGRIKK